MLVHITCPSCGESGADREAGEGGGVTCPDCGARFVIELVPVFEEDVPDGPATDEAIAAWLGRPRWIKEPTATAPDRTCPACGYAGPMPLDPPVCPACGEERRERATGRRRRLSCPDCGGPIEAERGRTVICPHCRSFLGCLVPEEARRHWWRRGG